MTRKRIWLSVFVLTWLTLAFIVALMTVMYPRAKAMKDEPYLRAGGWHTLVWPQPLDRRSLAVALEARRPPKYRIAGSVALIGITQNRVTGFLLDGSGARKDSTLARFLAHDRGQTNVLPRIAARFDLPTQGLPASIRSEVARMSLYRSNRYWYLYGLALVALTAMSWLYPSVSRMLETSRAIERKGEGAMAEFQRYLKARIYAVRARKGPIQPQKREPYRMGSGYQLSPLVAISVCVLVLWGGLAFAWKACLYPAVPADEVSKLIEMANEGPSHPPGPS